MELRFQFNDGGCAESGRRGFAGDCVCRALAILTEQPYEHCYKALATANKAAGRRKSARNSVTKRVYEPIFEAFGLRKVWAQSFGSGERLTFKQAYLLYGDCIVTTAKHVACLRNGALHDTHDCRTYEWEGEIRERKAITVWVKRENRFTDAPETLDTDELARHRRWAVLDSVQKLGGRLRSAVHRISRRSQRKRG